MGILVINYHLLVVINVNLKCKGKLVKKEVRASVPALERWKGRIRSQGHVHPTGTQSQFGLLVNSLKEGLGVGNGLRKII